MTRRNVVICAVLAALVLGFALIGAAVRYDPDVIGEMSALGMIAGAIAGSEAR